MSPIDLARSAERRLRILCCLHAREIGGVERVAWRLCGALADRADVTVALGRHDGPLPSVPGLRLRVAPRPPVDPRHYETGWMIAWLIGVVRRERPDVIFCAGNTYAVVAAALRLRLGDACPPIVLKVSNALERIDLPAPVAALYAGWCRWQGKAFARVIAATPAMAAEVARTMRLHPAAVPVIANPVLDDARWTALATAGDRPRSDAPGRRFVAAGRLVAQKNFPLLIDAFARGGEPDDRLVILGDGPERARLDAAIATRGMAGRIRLAGHRADIADWLADADAFLLSSDYEGLPAVVVEALAAGRPVIATDCCASMAALLADDRGTLVPPRDAAALAAAIAGFDARSFARTPARQFAAGFTVERVADLFLAQFAAAAVRTRSIKVPDHAGFRPLRPSQGGAAPAD